MSILISWLGPLRAICMAIDGIAYSLLDQAYNLVIKLSTAELFQHETIRSITNNLYILIGVVAFFRLALVLVNAIIDPEKLNEKGKGLSNIFFRVVGMIILLAVTPFLFQLSYDVQKRIVGADPDQNIIFKTLLGDKANISGENAGKALQNIAISSLITIDQNYLKADGKTCESEDDSDCGFVPLTCVSNGDGTCTNQGGYIFGDECSWDNCQKAVAAYNEMYVNENMSPSELSKWAGVSKTIKDENGDKQEIYVYNYMFLITTFVGGFMTYIIISFAIDIAVRMFELLVLEVLSPLFIATFVDPKSAQSGPFKNWLNAVGKSYISLYIKLAILALLVLLVSIINQSKIFTAMSDLGGWVKIFAIVGLLIFAKKAPKWIGDIIGIKGDDGLGGLSIGKKLGAMALAGGLATKAGRGLAGMTNSAKRGIGNAIRARKADKKEAYKNAGLGNWKDRHEKRKNLSAVNGGSYFAGRKALSAEKKAAREKAGMANAGGYAKQIGVGAMQGVLAFKGAASADSLKGALKTGKDSANKFKSAQQLSGRTMGEKIDKGLSNFIDNRAMGAYGDGAALVKREKAAKDRKTFENCTINDSNNNLRPGDIPFGEKGFIKQFTGSPDALKDANAAIGLMNDMRSVNPNIDKFSFDCSGDSIKITATNNDGSQVVRTINRGDKEYGEAVTNGSKLLKPEGIARIEDNVVALQQASANNIQQANEKVNQLSQANNAAQQTVAYNQQQADINQKLMDTTAGTMETALKKAFTNLPSDALSHLKLSPTEIDKKTLGELSNIYNDAMDKGIKLDGEGVGEYIEQYNIAADANKAAKEKYDRASSSLSTAQNVINNNNNSINAYQEYIKTWTPTFNSVKEDKNKTYTFEDITSILEKKRKDSSEIVQKYEKEAEKKEN